MHTSFPYIIYNKNIKFKDWYDKICSISFQMEEMTGNFHFLFYDLERDTWLTHEHNLPLCTNCQHFEWLIPQAALSLIKSLPFMNIYFVAEILGIYSQGQYLVVASWHPCSSRMVNLISWIVWLPFSHCHDIADHFYCSLQDHIDGLVQERRNSSVLAMDMGLSCNNSLILFFKMTLTNCRLQNLMAAIWWQDDMWLRND